MAPEAPRARASPGRGPSHRVATNAMPSGFASYAERGLRSLDLLGNTSASGLSLLRCLFCRRQTTKTSLHLFGPLGRRKGAPSHRGKHCGKNRRVLEGPNKQEKAMMANWRLGF